MSAASGVEAPIIMQLRFGFRSFPPAFPRNTVFPAFFSFSALFCHRLLANGGGSSIGPDFLPR